MTGQAAINSDHGSDPLLDAVAWIAAHHGQARSAASLVAGLPVALPLAADGALRVLREAGFEAGVIERPLASLSPLLMPAVMPLRGGGACVVTGVVSNDAGKRNERHYQVVWPSATPVSRCVGESELAAQQLGFVIVATPRALAGKSNTQAHAADALRPAGSHWLWGTLRRFVPYYRSALLAALLCNVLMLVSGIVTSVVFDKVIPHQAFVTLWSLAIGAGIALVFDMLSRQLRSTLIDIAGRKADLIISTMLFRQTLAVRMEHRPASAGAYAHHLAQVEIVREFFASATLAALSDLPFVLLFVAMSFIVGGPLGWVLVLALPLIVGIAWGIQGSLRRSMRTQMQQHADLQGVLVEAVEGLEDLKTAGAEGRFLHRYESAAAAAAEAGLRARMMSGWASNLSAAAQQLVTIVMLVWGVYLIHDGVISGGALIGAVMFAGRAVAPLASVVSLATRYQGARTAMLSLDRLMSLPTERSDAASGQRYVPLAVAGATGQSSGIGNGIAAIGLHEVSFAYPLQPSNPTPVDVLKDVNLAFKPGERVAILGRIGSGKSTILRLLAGLYQPTAGRVEINGLDLRQIDPADYRSGIGFVSQEPRLFNGSLRENVLLGRPAADAAGLAHVARLTGLDRLVAAHPMGWELPVGDMGALLSGGQRQLVALARCLVTQPRILLMDEPTSSMDAQSEIAFLRQLHEAAGDRLLVVVTHRPAVLELVERVVVVDAGRVVIDGPKPAVLAALAGQRPAPAPAPAAASIVASSTPATTASPAAAAEAVPA